MPPALADVGAAGLFTDGVELHAPHQVFQLQVAWPCREAHLEPIRPRGLLLVEFDLSGYQRRFPLPVDGRIPLWDTGRQG